MKIKFNLGMQFIFGYTESVGSTGPSVEWHVCEQSNDYLVELLANDILSKSKAATDHNMLIYNKIRKSKKL